MARKVSPLCTPTAATSRTPVQPARRRVAEAAFGSPQFGNADGPDVVAVPAKDMRVKWLDAASALATLKPGTPAAAWQARSAAKKQQQMQAELGSAAQSDVRQRDQSPAPSRPCTPAVVAACATVETHAEILTAPSVAVAASPVTAAKRRASAAVRGMWSALPVAVAVALIAVLAVRLPAPLLLPAGHQDHYGAMPTFSTPFAAWPPAATPGDIALSSHMEPVVVGLGPGRRVVMRLGSEAPEMPEQVGRFLCVHGITEQQEAPTLPVDFTLRFQRCSRCMLLSAGVCLPLLPTDMSHSGRCAGGYQ
jgi:hypothetical protein